MARTQRSTRNKNLNTASRKRSKNADESSSVPWPSLPYDVLLIILTQFGVIDFLAFSGVCRSWRSFALSHRESFMAAREPMSVSIPPQARRACSLVDLRGERMFKTILPNFSGRLCVGVGSGYLIMCGRKTYDFWLVNLITRHELQFPVLPSSVDFSFPSLRPILVYSPSGYVLVITFRYSKNILFSLNGAARWKQLSSKVRIVDLHALHGKIYVLHVYGTLGEMRLKLKPTLMQLKIENGPALRFMYPPDLMSLGDKLFMLCFLEPTLYVALELDTDKMEWVLRGDTVMKEYVLFLSDSKCGAICDPKKWADAREHFQDAVYLLGTRKDRWRYFSYIAGYIKSGLPLESVAGHRVAWYFPHDCYKVNRLED